jgi:hypothetical protein
LRREDAAALPQCRGRCRTRSSWSL